MPPFTILEHDFPQLHWDLLLDNDQPRIPTWKLACEPGKPPQSDERSTQKTSAQTITATRLADHRRIYLDYSGPVSGNRGHVSIWDRGQYALLNRSETCWELRLDGTRLSGFATLWRGDHDQWTYTYLPDET